MQPFEIQPQPDQLFIWAMARIPFETFAAEPVPDAKAALAQLNQRLSADDNWQRQFISLFKFTMTNDEISWRGLPFITPFVQAVREPAGDFLVGGFFPNAGQSRPLPPELSAALNPPNLVYYHWEVTGRAAEGTAAIEPACAHAHAAPSSSTSNPPPANGSTALGRRSAAHHRGHANRAE